MRVTGAREDMSGIVACHCLLGLDLEIRWAKTPGAVEVLGQRRCEAWEKWGKLRREKWKKAQRDRRKME